MAYECSRVRLSLFILSLASVFLVVSGCVKEEIVQHDGHAHDFKQIYGGALCLIHNCNPYDSDQIRAQYLRSGGDTLDLSSFKPNNNIYPPPSLMVVVPFALLPWPLAHWLWIALVCSFMIASSFLIADLCYDNSALLVPVSIALFLSQSTGVIVLGQSVAISVGLCVIAVWCLIRHRYPTLTVICFSLSLLLKPTAACLILLYFFFATARSRWFAVKILLLCGVLTLLSIVWINAVPKAHSWRQTLQANAIAMGTHGRSNDPSYANDQSYLLVNLQTVTSLIDDNSLVYNISAVSLVLLLMLMLGYLVAKAPNAIHTSYLSLASIACISLLSVYHHSYDCRLLILTFPAAAWLLRNSRTAGFLAILLSALAIIMTPPGFMIFVERHIVPRFPHRSTLEIIVLERCVVLLIVIMACFYLWCLWSAQKARVTSP